MQSFSIQFASAALSPQQHPSRTTTPRGEKFAEVLNQLSADRGKDQGVPLHQEIQQMQQQILSGAKIKPEQLLMYQIKVGRLGMQVELASKVVESALGTIRKLQNPQ